MDDIDRFALKVERKIKENKETIAALPEFERRKRRPLGKSVRI